MIMIMIMIVVVVVVMMALLLALAAHRAYVVFDKRTWKFDFIGLQQRLHDIAAHLLPRHILPALFHLRANVVLEGLQ